MTLDRVVRALGVELADGVDETHRGFAAIDYGETAKRALGHRRHEWHVRASRCISHGMEFLQPPTWREALEARAAHPDALPIWGGTDVMVEMNFARKRPEALLDLTRVDELSRWSAEDGWFRIGAGVSYTRVIAELGDALPGLAMASRTVGSPQIRNRGTIGGNLGSSSPAGDALPPLFAGGAEVELGSVRGIAARAGRGVRRRAEAQRARVRRADRGRVGAAGERAAAVRQGGYAQRDGDRGLLVRAGSSADGRVGTCIGSAGPTPIRAREAEAFAAGCSATRCPTRRRASTSASWSPPRRRRSTTCAGPPRTGATRWACSRSAR